MSSIKTPWRISADRRLWHNYRLDSAWSGYLRRLPDRTLVRAEDYEAELANYHAKRKDTEGKS